MENVAGEQGLAFQHLFLNKPYSFKLQTVIKSHSLMIGSSDLAILIFRHTFSISGIF